MLTDTICVDTRMASSSVGLHAISDPSKRGLRVSFAIEFGGTAKVIGTGNSQEFRCPTGMAHFMEHLLVRLRSSALPIGVLLHAETTADHIILSTKSLSDDPTHAADVLRSLLAIVRDPLSRDSLCACVEDVRQDVYNEIRYRESTRDYWVHKKVFDILFPDNIAGLNIVGTRESLSAIDLDHVVAAADAIRESVASVVVWTGARWTPTDTNSLAGMISLTTDLSSRTRGRSTPEKPRKRLESELRSAGFVAQELGNYVIAYLGIGLDPLAYHQQERSGFLRKLASTVVLSNLRNGRSRVAGIHSRNARVLFASTAPFEDPLAFMDAEKCRAVGAKLQESVLSRIERIGPLVSSIRDDVVATMAEDADRMVRLCHKMRLYNLWIRDILDGIDGLHPTDFRELHQEVEAGTKALVFAGRYGDLL